MERLAWFWSDWTAAWSPRKSRLAAALLFLVLYAGELLVALAFGEVRAFLGDLRWPAADLIVALSAYQLTTLPREIDRLWESLRPWLANPAPEIATLEALTRPMLARFFPASAAIWIAFVIIWVFTNSWGEPFQSRWLAPLLNATYGFGFFWYFLGAAAAANTAGLWLLFRRLGATLRFRPELWFAGGKMAVQPLNQVLWSAWRYFMAVIVLAGIGTPPIRGHLRLEDVALWTVIAALLALRLSTQRPIDRLLADEKARVLRGLQDRLDEARAAADDVLPDVLPRMHRVQILLHDLRTVEGVAPTLVDSRFVVQIALSVSATLIANVLLRTVLANLLGP